MRPFKRKPIEDVRRKFVGLAMMKYTDPAVLAAKCTEYFDMRDEAGKSYTVAGLISHLGFASRATLQAYREREEFHEVVERALLHIEDQRNEQLVKGQGVVAGQIFDLKVNHGWKDKDASEGHSGPHTKVVVVPIMPGSMDMAQWQLAWQQMLDQKQQASIEASQVQDDEIIDVSPLEPEHAAQSTEFARD